MRDDLIGLSLIASLLIIGGTIGFLGSQIIHGEPEPSLSSARLTTHVLSWDADDLYRQTGVHGFDAYCDVLDRNLDGNTEHQCLVAGYNYSSDGRTPVVGRVDCEFESHDQYMKFFYNEDNRGIISEVCTVNNDTFSAVASNEVFYSD